jgi:hypothetical protein
MLDQFVYFCPFVLHSLQLFIVTFFPFPLLWDLIHILLSSFAFALSISFRYPFPFDIISFS